MKWFALSLLLVGTMLWSGCTAQKETVQGGQPLSIVWGFMGMIDDHASTWSRPETHRMTPVSVRVRQKRLSHSSRRLNLDMQTFSEVEQEAMKLQEAQRATLACRLLDSLPAVLSDDDEGVAEALRRDAELEGDPAAGLSLKELRRALKR